VKKPKMRALRIWRRENEMKRRKKKRKFKMKRS
jgi:hypothetical protein